MKKIPLFVTLLFVVFLSSCYEDYKFDFDHTATYFARQFPLRTIIIEDEKELTFDVGVVLGGKYKNETEEKVKFHIEPTLLDEYPDLKILPDTYYELSNNSEIVIPSGKFGGAITVNLKKEFVDDAVSHTPVYALPLKIDKEGTSLDSVLLEKDFTIIVVKFVNKYHGGYWLKGVDYSLDMMGQYSDTIKYTDSDLVLNRDLVLTTLGERKSKVPYIGFTETPDKKPDQYTMILTLNEDGSGLLTGNDQADIKNVVGAARYDERSRNFTFNYGYEDAKGVRHQVFDTLTYRDTRLVLEHWKAN